MGSAKVRGVCLLSSSAFFLSSPLSEQPCKENRCDTHIKREVTSGTHTRFPEGTLRRTARSQALCPGGQSRPRQGPKKKATSPRPHCHLPRGMCHLTGMATATAPGLPASPPQGEGQLPPAPRTTAASRPPGPPPCNHLPRPGLCHLPGPPESPPRATRAASPGWPAPRRSGRPGACRLRERPPLRAQPAWRVSAAGRGPPAALGDCGPSVPATSSVSLVASSPPREGLPRRRARAPPTGRRLSGERGRVPSHLLRHAGP